MQTEELELVSKEATIPPESQSLTLWDKLRDEALRIKVTAETLTIKSVDDKAGMALARATRLAIREVRLAIEKKHKELKKPWLEGGLKVDGDKNKLLEIIEPLEDRLKKMEQFAISEGIRLEDERRRDRAARLSPFLTGPCPVDLGKIPEEEFQKLLADAHDLMELRLKQEAEARAIEEARVAAEAAEWQRIREENERLKQEAIAWEKKAEAERKIAEDAMRAEGEASEKLQAQQQASEAAEKKRNETVLAASRKAAAAPDAEKLRAFGNAVMDLPFPKVSDASKGIAGVVIQKRAEFAAWIDRQADAMAAN